MNPGYGNQIKSKGNYCDEMKKFTITEKMLGSREVISILKTPLKHNVLHLLKEEYGANVHSWLVIDDFLAPLSIVRSQLKKGCISVLLSYHIHDAINNGAKISRKSQRLLGPQIESLLEIAPRMDLLVAGKEFMEGCVFPYPDEQDNPEVILEEVNRFLGVLKTSRTTMPEDVFQLTAGHIGEALTKEKERLLLEKRFLLPRLPKKLDETGMIVKEALDAVLGVIFQ